MSDLNASNIENLKFELYVSEPDKNHPNIDYSNAQEISFQSASYLRSQVFSSALEYLTEGVQNAKLLKISGGVLLDGPFTAIGITLDAKEEGVMKATITGITSSVITTTVVVTIVSPIIATAGLPVSVAFVTGLLATAVIGYVVDSNVDKIYDSVQQKWGEFLYNEDTKQLTYQTTIEDLKSIKDLITPIYECSIDENGGEYLKGISINQIIEGSENKYIIESGDTIWGLSQRYGVSEDELIELNPWLSDRFSEDGNFALIRPGEQVLLPGGSSEMAQKIREPFTEAQSAEVPRDPLLIDLDGDGIETTSVENGVYFDQENDGFAEVSAWVSSDDGVLAIDKNNNGTIDNGSELFGDSYVKSDGTIATSGFDALSDLDSNGDGQINSSDTSFDAIKILKGDGTLLSLSDAGISSISLTAKKSVITDSNGNRQLTTGTYTKTDGSTGKISDYELQSDPMNSIATDWLEVSEEIVA